MQGVTEPTRAAAMLSLVHAFVDKMPGLVTHTVFLLLIVEKRAPSLLILFSSENTETYIIGDSLALL